MSMPDQPNRGFPTTRWSLVEQASSQQAQQALTELINCYVPALRRFIATRFRLGGSDVDDIIQGFLLDKLLVGSLLERANKDRGRFRNLLCLSLRNYTISTLRKKRDTQSLSVTNAEHDSSTAFSDAFDRAWARQVIGRSLRRTRKELMASGRLAFWHLLRLRVIRPTLAGSAAPGYAELVDKLQFADPAEAHARLATGKRMLNRYLRDIVADYSPEQSSVDEELRALKRAVSSDGAR